ncbi:MAG TPA: DNA mismatch repair endonuclease MutL [Dehalococcoidia bacterium]|nr:DNA mismatch repair endonuclease MutL [Dehalococcoidia bacterium]
MTIRVLSPLEAARIAAGEVIERPASVVKELIENSLDAGASRISVEVREGGLALIRVVDDGCGIPPHELRLAFERHATSKLASEADLQRIETLGFRGEALPSIAAAADVEIVSRVPDSMEGRRLLFEAGEAVEEGPEASPPGTSVTVRGLFRRQPARLKFVRSPAAEAGHIATVVSRYALAYPEVQFTLRIDGRVALQAPGTGDPRDAAAAVYGPRLAGALVTLRPEADLDALGIALAGLIAPPDVTRASRADVSLFLNRRWVRNRSLTFAVEEGYQGQLLSGRHPLAIVHLRLPPDEVDPNVHPTKAEVRLRREREVLGVVRDAVRATLARLSAARAVAPATPPPQDPASVGSGDTRKREELRLASPAYQSTLAPSGGDETARREAGARLPVLRPVGQVGALYIVAESPEGMCLIDQHAAHERVLYERFLDAVERKRPDSQPLLAPEPVELTARHRALVAEYLDELRAQGYDLEPFGDDGVWALRALPSAVAGRDAGRSLTELLDLLEREEGMDDRRHRVAASLACHAAVRAGQTLSDAEMRELIEALEACRMPRTCPHGRPTMLHLRSDDLAREFRRR